MQRRVAVLGAMTIVILGCARNPVPVLGAPTDVAMLAGEWVGEYTSGESGREGSILFTLEAGADTARGDIMMIPLDPDQPYSPPIDEFDPTRTEELRGFLLTISWVAIHGDRVEGTLSPYRDPTCGCELETVFVGSLSGDHIEGTFRSLHRETGVVQTGYWSARRKQ